MNQPLQDLAFTGERYMPGIAGNIEIEHVHRYLYACEITAGKSVLDIASGEGYGSAMLARRAARVIGVDIAEDAVRHAQERYGNERLAFRTGTCAAIPVDDASIDVVVSFETIEHHDQHEEMMREIKRVLRPGGVLLISSPDRHHYSDVPGYHNEFHVKELYEQEFKQLLARHFQHQSYLGQRVQYGSLILPMTAASGMVSYRSAEGGVEATSGVARPLYWIALASDQSIDPPMGGIMEQSVEDSDYVRNWIREVQERDSRIDVLNLELRTHIAQMTEQARLLMEQSEEIARRDAVIERYTQHIVDRKDAVQHLEQQRQVAVLAQEAERVQLAGLQQELLEVDLRCKQYAETFALQLAGRDHDRREAEQSWLRQSTQLHGQIDGLRDSMEQLLRSRSWRLTAPLRSIRTALAGSALPGRQRMGLWRAFALVQRSGLFDAAYYLFSYADVREAGIDPLKHYLVHGWREHRDPSPTFSTAAYLAQHPDVARAGVNPLVHYVRFGLAELRVVEGQTSDSSDETGASQAAPVAMSAEAAAVLSPAAASASVASARLGNDIDEAVAQIERSGMFDVVYYRAMYADLRHAAVDLVRHYCAIGWQEGRNPSPVFNTRYYLDTYPDIRNAGMNPFWHYVIAGAKEQRSPMPPPPRHENDEVSAGATMTDIRLVARYAWPDWAPNKAARPLFEGHAQPVLPDSEWGCYELPDANVFGRQAELALRHGIQGFCLDLDATDAAPSRSVPLLQAWLDSDVAIAFCVNLNLLHDVPPDEVLTLAGCALAAPRALQVGGRPLLVATVPSNDAAAYAVLVRLRFALDRLGIVRFHLLARWELVDPDDRLDRTAGVADALLEGPAAVTRSSERHVATIVQRGVDTLPYSVVVAEGLQRMTAAGAVDDQIYRTVVLGRDLTTKAASPAGAYTSFQLLEFRRWLDAAIDEARRRHAPDQRLVFIDAWNDWNEGLFLEPDQRSGFARLNETTRALLGLPCGLQMPKVTVLVPNYNHARFLKRRLDSIYAQTYRNLEVILMDDCSTDDSREVMTGYAERYPVITRKLFNDRNTGSAFRQWAKGIAAADGDLVWIAESDDFCDPNFLEVLVRCFDDEAVMLAHARCVFVDQNEQPMPNHLQQYVADLGLPGKWEVSHTETAHNEVRCALGIKNTIPNASGVLFRRPVDLQLLTDESWLSMRVAGDWIFYLTVLQGGKISYTVDTANYFRRYIGSTAEVTYRREVFYREVGMASRTVAERYDVPIEVLDRCRQGYAVFYDRMLGHSSQEFEAWYDYVGVIEARRQRLPNVMVCTMAFSPGGAEILPIRLANEFKRAGLSVVLFSAGSNPREDRIRRMLRRDVPLVETSSVEEMKAMIASFGIEALNTHQWHIQKYPCSVPDVFHGLRSHVASLHGMIEHGTAFAVTDQELHQADANVSVWVYTADKNIKPFVEIGLFDPASPRFEKLPNGMQPPRIRPESRRALGIPDDAFVLCCVSRAIPDKGWAEAIEVVTQARQLSGRDVRLLLVGNGEVYDALCNTGVPDFVHLVGFHENSVGHYSIADMGIMLTWFRSESFPLTILDCLFAGKPYIATDVGEIRNTLTTPAGIAGEVVALEDWQVPIEATAAAVAAFASDRQKYERALDLVPQIASRYHIDKVAGEYVRLFMSDIRKPGAGSRDAEGMPSVLADIKAPVG